VFKSLYKFIIIACYEYEYGRFFDFGNFCECFVSMPWVREDDSIIEALLRYVGDVKEKDVHKSIYSINGVDFSFNIKGLSSDNIDARINQYAQKLYDLDVNREIVDTFPFKSLVGIIFGLAQDATGTLDIVENTRLGAWGILKKTIVDFDSEIPLEYFAVPMLINHHDIMNNDHNLYRAVSLMEYTSRGLNAYVYKIQPDTKHIINYMVIHRQRRLNKNSTIERDVTNNNDVYNELKDMTQYLYNFKDGIRKLSNAIDKEGKLILRTYNDIMVLERQNLSHEQIKELNLLIDEYIMTIGEIANEKEVTDDFIDLVTKIKNLYKDVMGEYDGYFGGE
jgi:hypothetical protein